MSETLNRCPRCHKGLLRQSTADELSCLNCGHIVPLNSKADRTHSLLDEWERNAISDALTEIYLRTRGNIRRSQLPSTKAINEEKADRLQKLLRKVKQL